MTRLEGVQPLDGPGERLLDDVVGVEKVVRPPGKAASGPAAEALQVASAQEIERRGVSRPRQAKELLRGLRVGATAGGMLRDLVRGRPSLLPPIRWAGTRRNADASYPSPLVV